MFQEYLKELSTAIDIQNIALSSSQILIILALWWGLTRLAHKILNIAQSRLLDRHNIAGTPPTEHYKRISTLMMLLRQGLFIFITAITLLLGLKHIGIDIAPILASAGILGLAIGFGAQNLVRDIISGFFLILENQVRVGDVATINGTGGLVEQVNFRTLILRDLTGTTHVFPNGEIKTIANLTSSWSAYVFDIGVSYNEDLDKVIQVMKSVGNDMRHDPAFEHLIIEDFEIFGVDQFADSAIIIKGRVKTKPIQQWNVGREYRKRLKQRFDLEGITIPFPQRDLHVKSIPEEFYTLQPKEGHHAGNSSQPPHD